MPASSDQPVILIDVMNLVFRCHYAFQNLQHEGQHTGVLYGVLKTIDQLRTNVSKRLVFCWDHGIPIPGAVRPRNWREDVVPAYKANRKRDDATHKIVVSQLLELAEIINDCLGYTNIGIMGLEADDVIGILSRAYSKVLIFSSDKDFYQLLTKNISILVPKKDKKSFNIITRDDVETEYGISIDRWAEYLALGGDSADNIKPMRGMGPKTAIKLIQAGADLRGNSSFEEQTKAFQSENSKYRECWVEILKSYHASQIPTDPKDPRIHTCLKTYPKNHFQFSADQYWKSQQHKEYALKKFIAICADRNMVSILSVRQKFFNTQPEESKQWDNQQPRKSVPPKHSFI